MRRKERLNSALRGLMYTGAAVAAVLMLGAAADRLERQSSQEGRVQLEDAVRRSAVACYAEEGYYPPTLAYLQEHYGLQVDESRYSVDYEVFAENLMPQITVLDAGVDELES